MTNTSDKPVYSVWVKIWSNTPGVSPQDIEFKVDDNPDAIILGDERFSINSDILALYVTDIQESFVKRLAARLRGGTLLREAILLRFYELLPHKPRRMIVSGKTKLKSTGIAMVLNDFKQKPDELLRRQRR